MENDQRLTPLPIGASNLQPAHIDYSPGYTPSYDESLENKRSIRQYFNIVYKRLPIIIGLTIVITAAAAFYSFRQPSIFEARTGIIIEPRKPAVTQKDSININFGDDEKYYKTQLQLLQNGDLMKRVVVALGMHRQPGLFPEGDRGITATFRSLFSGGQKPPEPDNSLPVVSDASIEVGTDKKMELTPEEDRRAALYAGNISLTVEPVERTSIVYLKVQSSNPSVTAKVADKLAVVFAEEDYQRESSGAKAAYEELGTSIERLKQTILDQEAKFIAAMRSSNLPLMKKGEDLRATDLEVLIKRWREAQSEVANLNAKLTAAEAAEAKGDILAVLTDNKAIQDARTRNDKRRDLLDNWLEEIDKKINTSEEKLKTLGVRYTDAHPDFISETERLKALKDERARVSKDMSKKIDEEGSKAIKGAEREALTSLRSQLSAARNREARHAGEYRDALAKANFEGQAETELTTMISERESNQKLLDTYIARQKEQELALANIPRNIKIHSNAVEPGGPVGPPRTRNIMIAFLLSLGVGVGLAFLLDYLDDSVRTSDDISRHLGLPTLALIPHHLPTEKRKLLPGKNGGGAMAPGNALITLDERTSPMAEAYRHLRTSLLFSSAGKPPKTILVTSSQPSEGKTTTAINTAITLAQSDVDVVIIDCDLRRPRLHSHFGLDNNRGLTNYLSGDKETEGLIRTYPDLPRLKVITSGPIPPNPAELLSSNEMRNLLQFLSGKFKHVIIDSPPAISFTDASILSTLVDGVVLVAMANKSSIHLMRQFKQRVSNIGARIYGVVLNGIRSGSTEYYYYGSGYYNYYSRPDGDESTPYLDDQQGRDT
ncbi:MAG: GumC family protein [Pyrinomonadaceae bacterium]